MLIILRICEQAAPKIRRVLSHPGPSLWGPLCLLLPSCLAGNRVSSSRNHVVLHTKRMACNPASESWTLLLPYRRLWIPACFFRDLLTLAFLPQPIQFQPAKFLSVFVFLSKYSILLLLYAFCLGFHMGWWHASSVAFLFHMSWH